MEIYLDNAATTRVLESVAKKTTEIMLDNYGNPSSLNLMGIRVEREIKAATEKIARVLNAKTDEIVFTSGGTEANNLAILGVAAANRRKGKHIITSAAEHPSVLEPLKYLENEGFEVTYLTSLDGFEAAIRSDTILASIMHVNNETGVMCDLDRISKFCKNKGVIFHSDGVQAFGKHEANLANIDLYSFSAHKIHGGKGVGALYVKKGTKIKPIIFGGGQQNGLRSGTENTAGIIAFGIAAEYAKQTINESRVHVSALKERLLKAVDLISGVSVNIADSSGTGSPGTGSPDTGSLASLEISPYILNLSFESVRGEVLLHLLEQDGIYISTGAACHSKKVSAESHALRFSFSSFNTMDEIDVCLDSLIKNVKKLRG